MGAVAWNINQWPGFGDTSANATLDEPGKSPCPASALAPDIPASLVGIRNDDFRRLPI